MEWQKSPEELIDRFDRALPDDPRVQRRKMFGYPSAFAGGNMFAGLHGAKVIVRLAEEARAELLAIDGATIFEPMAGRPMREYVVIPNVVLDDPTALQSWIERSFEYARSLPPKEKDKSPKTKSAAARSPRKARTES